ncbi:MAG: hypothetical protein SGI96_13845 [Bacteroidota bacterium]|nr:hypothetical protein [Bacteroidota bacterium]
MKKILLLCLFGLFFLRIIQAQSITLLPSAGIQTTVSTIQGCSPVINSSHQYQTNFSASLRAYIDNKKGHGLFIGVAVVNNGISVNTFDNINTLGRMSSGATVPRIEIGYQMITRPVYFNSILNNRIEKNSIKYKNGFFFQLQSLAGVGYNLGSRNGGIGGIGGGTSTLTNIYIGGRNFSLLTGGNIYIGKNNRQWFFISLMRNWNFGNHTSTGIFNSQHNGDIYQNNIKSFGSGNAFTIGVPIRLGGKKKK